MPVRVTTPEDYHASSHNRSVSIYVEALESNCTLWGVRPTPDVEFDRYDT